METIVDTIRLVKRAKKQLGREPVDQRPRLPQLRDAIDRAPVLLEALACVREALDTLVEDGLQAALVVDDRGRPLGEFTQANALQLLASGAYHDRRHEGCRKLRDVMRSGAFTVSEQEDPFALAARLASENRELAAIVRDGELVGTVTRAGLLGLLARVHDPECGAEQRVACRADALR